MEHTALQTKSPLADAREMVEWWVSEPATGLIRRSLVIDRLLDLRSLVSSSPMLLAETAHLLTNTPGRSVVEAEWWNVAAAKLLATIERVESLAWTT